jgi:hypothetical protein
MPRFVNGSSIMNYSKRHLIHYFRPPNPVLVDWSAWDRHLDLSIKRDCYFMGGGTIRDEPESAGPEIRAARSAYS